MKRIICTVLSLMMVFMLGVEAFAANEENVPNISVAEGIADQVVQKDKISAADKKALYETYQSLIDEANEKYGYHLTLLPYEEISSFCSKEEFKNTLDEYCAFKSEATTEGISGSITPKANRGAGVSTVSCTVRKTHGTAVVTIVFYGTFDVRENLDGTYYVYSDTYTDPIATSNSSSTYYVANGHVRRTFIDGGRTRKVSQNFDVYVKNVIKDSVTVNAYYYFNKTTGAVTSNIC